MRLAPQHETDPERIKRVRLLSRLDDNDLRRRLIRDYDRNRNGGTDRLMRDIEHAKEAE